MPNHCYYLVFSFTNHLYPYSYIYSLAMHLRYSSAPLVYWRASEASETVLGVDNAKSGICYWRASVASETLTGVTQSKIGDVYLFIYLYICLDVCMSFCTLTLRIFVFARRSTPSQTSLNRILWFSDHYPYHLRN